MNTVADVSNSQGWENRRAIGITAHIEHTSVSRSDGVISRSVSQRAALAEAGDRTHHDSRIQRLDSVVSESHPPNNSGRIVFDQHVDLGDQGLDNRQTCRTFHIDAEAHLASILLYVVGAAAVAHKGQG